MNNSGPIVAAIVGRLGRGQSPAQVKRWLEYAYPRMQPAGRSRLLSDALDSIRDATGRAAGESYGVLGCQVIARLSQLAASGDHRAAVTAAADLARVSGSDLSDSQMIRLLTAEGYLVTVDPSFQIGSE
jgi:hypothetical protein